MLCNRLQEMFFSYDSVCNGLNCKEGQNIKALGMRSLHADCVACAAAIN